MLPVLFYLVLSNTVGETPFAPGIQAIEAEARLFPPKRSPWHGKGDTALKVTLWETPGTPKATLRKMRVDATHDGTASRDTYWFEDGQLAWGIQTRPDAERRLTFARGHLAGYKVPRSIDFVDELPRSPAGKILKAELREPYWSGHTRAISA